MTATFPDGAAWLDRLPGLVSEMEDRWGVIAGETYNLSYSYVARAAGRNNRSSVLKLGVPGPSFTREAEVLSAYGGGAMAELVEADPARGAMLLERIEPGHLLTTVSDDDAATRIAATVMRDLRRAAPAGLDLEPVSSYAGEFERLRRRFNGETGPFPAPLVDRAERLFRELVSSSAPPALLHGDLHHWNVLSGSRRDWIAIDPKGLVGEPAYETGALLRNPDASRYTDRALQRRRVRILAEELSLDPERIRSWGFAQAVLAAWWHFEDGGEDWFDTLGCAEALSVS